MAATQATLGILPTVCLKGAVIAPVTILVPVFAQWVAIAMEGGITLGNRATGKEATVSKFRKITIIETILDRTGCSTNTLNTWSIHHP